MGAPEARPTRGSRRKQRNRERLVAAAEAVLSRKGVDATTIAEITEEADLGFGTFYNHFESKEAIVDEVLSTGLEALGAALDKMTEGMDDPAEVLSVAIRHVLAITERNPVFGWFVLRTPDASARLTQHLRQRAERDIRRGLEKGRFRIEDPDALTVAMNGIILEGTRVKLAGTQTADLDSQLTAYCLRLFGLDESEAAAVARTPLPPIE